MKRKKEIILVVDDEQGMRQIIGDILTSAGFDIELAANGVQGLAAVKSKKPDLILSDIQMPSMNGYELLDEIKKDSELAKIPFVFMTGVNVGSEDLRKGMGMGADDYLTKPFSDQALLSAIESRLRKKQLWQQFVETALHQTHTDFFLLLSNDLHLLTMDILDSAQSLATENKLTPEKIRTAAQAITQSGRHLNRLHENILFYSLLQIWVKDRGKIDSLRKESLESYLSILDSVVFENGRMSRRHDSIVTKCRDAGLQISSVDFAKIMDELIGNACKYSPQGSRISITSSEHDGKLELLIHNEGPGMSKEQIAGIVSLQQDHMNATDKKGTGLGLIIAKTLAELYGGRLTIESMPGQGTTVAVVIPKAT